MRLILRFLQIPKREKIFFIEALFFLFYSKILLSLFPFKHCIKKFRLSDDKGNRDISSLPKIRQALSRANRLAFWKNICLVKSFAGKLMLQRRHIDSVLYLGLKLKDGKELIAHAWLVSGDYSIIVKGPVEYKEIYHI